MNPSADKYKKLFSNTAIMAIGSFGAKILSFFLLRLYTGVLTEAEYGIADLIYQTVNILYPILTVSMADAVIRFGLDRGYSNKRVFSNALFVSFSGLTLFAFVTPALGKIEEFTGLLIYLYLSCFFSCLRQVTAIFVRSAGMVKLFAADGILATVTIVIGNVAFLVGLNLGVKGYLLSIILSDFCSILFLFFVGNLKRFIDFKRINGKILGRMIRYSLPLVPTYVLWWITSASDRFFVIYYIGETQNGVYSAAYKIPTLLMIFTNLFFQAWQMSAIENKDDKELADFYGKIYNSYISLLFLACCGLVMIAQPLSDIMLDTSKEFAESYLYTAPLILATAFQCGCQFLSSVYNLKKKSVNSCLTALCAAGMNILLNFLFIPRFGVMGAAAATVCAYAVCFIVRLIDTTRMVHFKPQNFRTFINTIITVGSVLICISVSHNKILWLAAVFAVCLIVNISPLLRTFRKIIKRV
ncbi:MAG: polysaccharide biosynthesis C-terminal domain-containing protein [Ruminococcus sp.]|nr:polysaccharide biosynthesis C-terminal domain-containing protein [Ruminococcus sp.]